MNKDLPAFANISVGTAYEIINIQRIASAMMFLTPFDKFSLLTNSGHRNAISLHTKYHTGKYHNRPEAMLEVRGNTEEWHSLSFLRTGNA